MPAYHHKTITVLHYISHNRKNKTRKRYFFSYGFNLKIIGIFLLAFFLLFSINSILFINKVLLSDIPNINEIPLLFEPPNGLLYHPTRIYDRTGKKLLFSFSNPSVSNIQYYQLSSSNNNISIPSMFIEALLENEDELFWSHPGFIFDWRNISSIIYPHTIQEKILEKYILEKPKHLKKIIQRLLLAYQITNIFGRERILEWYINNSYYGRLSTGLDAASQTYFSKKPTQLNIAESTLLATLIKTPKDNPIDNPKAAINNRNALLYRLWKKNKISQEEYKAAIETPLPSITTKDLIHKLPFNPFINAVSKQLAEVIGWENIEQGGWNIISTQDYDLQNQSECLIDYFTKQNISRVSALDLNINKSCLSTRYLIYEGNYDIPENINIIMMDSKSSQVLAYASLKNENNDAINSYRPAGTILFPFIYLAGLSEGLTTSSLLPRNISPSQFEDLLSSNSNYQPIRLRVALANQDPLSTNEIVEMIGKENIRYLLTSLGIQTSNNGSQATSIIDTPVNLLDLAHAYNIFANNGIKTGVQSSSIDKFKSNAKISPVFILKAYNHTDKILFDWSISQTEPAINQELCYIINNMLSDDESYQYVFKSTPLTEYKYTTSIAIGKTDSHKDLWIIGYNPSVLTGIWIGNESNFTYSNLDPHIQLWTALMKYTLRGKNVKKWQIPEGIIEKEICEDSGLLSSDYCPSTLKELYVRGTEPIEKDYFYKPFFINKETGKMATLYTSFDNIELKIFGLAQSYQEQTILPKEYDTLFQNNEINFPAKIIFPNEFSYLRSNVNVLLSFNDSFEGNYRLLIGQGLYPKNWLQIASNELPNDSNSSMSISIPWDTKNQNGLYVIQLQSINQANRLFIHNAYVVLDNTPPAINPIYPKNDSKIPLINNIINITVEARDNTKISKIIFTLDDQVIASFDAPPYSLPWKATIGKHSLIIKAVDAAGNENSQRINFTVIRDRISNQ